MKAKTRMSRVLAGLMVMCMMLTFTCCAAPNEGVNPRTMYFYGGSVEVGQYNGQAAILVSTDASQKVDHIYHDVAVYYNGVHQFTNRYENWGKLSLDTTIYLNDVSSGDYVQVYTTHYTDHDGCVESASAYDSYTY
ncbi:MAG: hypothetical protein E7409_06685 [Ruminococcaceae bacterium]|nr:hypothetical protein [Oscillospiraceae bacterium]